MRLNLTAEEKKRARPEAIEQLLKIYREDLNNRYRNDHEEIKKDIKELEDLLEEINSRA